jgi:hypothetical protein
MHFHPGWSGPTQGFGHGGYHTGDSRYRHVGYQQDRRVLGQENQTVRNAKLDHPVSQEDVVAPGGQHELEAMKGGSSANQSQGIQGKTWPRSKTSADGDVKSNVEKNIGEVAVE